MKFSLLSENTITMINKILEDDELVKLIDSNSNCPFNSEAVKNKGGLIMKKIFPVPFTGEVPESQETNLRVFFSNGSIENRVVLDTTVVFQIVIHKNLWSIFKSDKKTMALRPYEIMNKIVENFVDKTIDKVGVLHFADYEYYSVDKDYGFFNLEARMMTV